MLRYPIRPAVVSNGTRFGTSVTSTIRSELEDQRHQQADEHDGDGQADHQVAHHAALPFRNTTLVPVMVTRYLSGLNRLSSCGARAVQQHLHPFGAHIGHLTVMRVRCRVLSRKAFAMPSLSPAPSR